MFEFILGVLLSVPWYIWVIGFIIWLGFHQTQKRKETKRTTYNRDRFIKEFELEDGTTDVEALIWLNVLNDDAHKKH